jgi:hypothetical protein
LAPEWREVEKGVTVSPLSIFSACRPNSSKLDVVKPEGEGEGGAERYRPVSLSADGTPRESEPLGVFGA